MKKLDRVQESLRILQEAGIRVPGIYQIKIENAAIAAEGTVEIWKCKKCPGWRYDSPIRALDVECPSGHFAIKDWDILTASLPASQYIVQNKEP